MKIFYVLVILTGSGHGESFGVDHYSTLAECEAAKAVITEHVEDTSPFFDKKIFCLEAKVK